MHSFFVDLHIHVGINEEGKWVKIPTSRELTIRNILREASKRKGMDMIGIVDAMSPLVQRDLEKLIQEGLLISLGGGGYRHAKKLTLLLGAEIETSEERGGLAHTLIFLPDLAAMREFTAYMSQFIRNIHISSQNAHMPLAKLIEIASAFEAAIIPAHVFTPHKSLYGACTTRMAEILPDKAMQTIAAIELGLSADTFMADRIAELAPYSFLTNSDAHSLAKIAREYNVMTLAEANWQELVKALGRREGREIAANYGLNPLLGKYHTTFCPQCNNQLPTGREQADSLCPYCNSRKVITGVSERISDIADYALPVHPDHRPRYHYQIPLEFIPGLGPKSLEKLLAAFGTEMAIIHRATEEQLAEVIGSKLARRLAAARSGEAPIAAGGGGYYGRLLKN